MAKIDVPTLILQCSEDIIASMQVGEFVRRQIPDSEMIVLEATGHCPNLSAPNEVIAAISIHPTIDFDLFMPSPFPNRP